MKSSENIRKKNETLRIITLKNTELIPRVLQWLQFTRPNTTFELLNFLSEFSFFWDFSPRTSLTTLQSTALRICILCILWVAEALSVKSTVFKRLHRLQVPKRKRVDFTMKLRRPKSIVAVVKILCCSCKFW